MLVNPPGFPGRWAQKPTGNPGWHYRYPNRKERGKVKRTPVLNGKPAVAVTILDLKSVETKRRNQYDSGFWVESQGTATWTALATRRMGKISLALGEMTDRPTKCLVVAAPDGQSIYLIPGIDHEQAVDVKYIDGRAQMNLNKLFTLLEKLVAPGNREFYPIVWPDHPVSFEGKEFRALMMLLEKTETKRVKTVRSKKKKAGKSAQPAQEAAAGEQST